MDVFGSHVDRCSVEGVNEGFTVHSNNTIDQKNKSEIAGGFTGYADLGRLSENKVTGLKQVTSGQIAGGSQERQPLLILQILIWIPSWLKD